VWPLVVAANTTARELQSELRAFRPTLVPDRAVIITPVIAVVCVVAYIACLIFGGKGPSPTRESMVRFGALLGVLAVFYHEIWRLFTCVFLHFDPLHIAMNMWCLLASGPTVERFFGRVGFTALYLFAGVGGAIASLWIHPTFLCAGASGAIFGVF